MLDIPTIIPPMIISGQPVSKKNAKGLSYWRKDFKTGRKVMRNKPVPYYTNNYKEYVKNTVPQIMLYVNQHWDKISNIVPIHFKINICFQFFFRGVRLKQDISNFYEAPQDILSASKDARSVLGEQPAYKFQILRDDSLDIIGSHDGSRAYFDKMNPRTEIYITEFKELYEIKDTIFQPRNANK